MTHQNISSTDTDSIELSPSLQYLHKNVFVFMTIETVKNILLTIGSISHQSPPLIRKLPLIGGAAAIALTVYYVVYG